ncbi:MAG TPA: D-alanine--D-alanine ligase family protein [Acidimicrobiales bacterium]|jgi:D-alanine-D-alanine ligase
MPGIEPEPRIRLLVLYGGRSAEHEVSCISARHVVAAADPQRYDLRVVGITTDGRWVDTTAALATGLPARALPSPDDLPGAGESGSTSLEPVRAVTETGAGPVVVLPLLHGPMGEDGTVQGLLEIAGVPYCGPGVAGSAAAMDKGLTKALLAAARLPQAGYLFFREHEIDEGLADRVERTLGWPVFVKPANMGSSIGISRVEDGAGLAAAVDLVRRFDEFVIIEEAVRGRELEIGVLGWPDLRASVPGEIIPSHDFYDFEDKYVDGAAALEVPASLPDGVAAEMGRLAIAACRALRVDSMARVDFFFEEGGRGLLLNEVNTIPGFTPISMYPRMWRASGVRYPALVDELVAQALRRAGRRSAFEAHRP